ncbi:hypothetical protein [Nonomuraea rubra]|uniref:hypothetical protein n=1 Tax=Nonomuraea rubra TaxID=46180 RepID=UPI003401E9C7
MTRLVYLATSRTGNNPRQHELFEIALIERAPGGERASYWRLQPKRMPEADPEHLRAADYFAHPHPGHDVVAVDRSLGTMQPVDPWALARELQARLFDAVVVSLDPIRDLAFVAAWLEARGALPGWRRGIDATALAVGALQGLLHGWYGAGRALDRPIGPPQVDPAAAAELPWNPYRLAATLGIKGAYSDASDAALRADLTLALWNLIYAPHPAPVEAPAPSSPAAAVPEPRPAAAGDHPYPDDKLVAPPTAPPVEGPPRRADETAVLDMAGEFDRA